MDIIQLYRDFNVPFATEGHKHCREGWVNTTCPFCTGNPGLHLGYHLTDDYYVCWRCGWKSTYKTLAVLLHVTDQEAKEIARKYGGKSRRVVSSNSIIRHKRFRLPPSTASMNNQHRKYLIKRKFDPDTIERIWNVQGTGPISIMDNISYSHRLVIPIYWENRKNDNSIVSFQTRDITNKHILRYIACPEQREIVKHKHIFYQAIPTKEIDTCICVEGVTDAWRFGYGAIAVFGIKYTKFQVREISKRFKRVFVMFDEDPQAVIQARKLASELTFRGVDAEPITIKGDPGDMSQDEANTLKKRLLGYI